MDYCTLVSSASRNFPTYDQYRASAQNQNFPFPDTVTYYITKNPSTPKVYQKLIQSCKYFFTKNSILVLHCLIYHNKEWQICSSENDCSLPRTFDKKIPLNKILSKIWVENSFTVLSTRSKFASKMISKFYKFDGINIEFIGQKLTINEFLFYTKNSKKVDLEKTKLFMKDGSELSCEDIVEKLPHLTHFIYEFNKANLPELSETPKKLIALPHFKNLEYIALLNVPESFDIDTFCLYLTQHKKTKAAIYYADQQKNNIPLSNAYKIKLQGIVDKHLAEIEEILYSKKRLEYFPFFIYFLGDAPKRCNQLWWYHAATRRLTNN